MLPSLELVLKFISQGLEILHAYSAFKRTPNYKVSFNYPWLLTKLRHATCNHQENLLHFP